MPLLTAAPTARRQANYALPKTVRQLPKPERSGTVSLPKRAVPPPSPAVPQRRGK